MAEIEVKVEDNSKQIKAELEKAVERVLFAWGTVGVEGCVEKAEEDDAVTKRPTVDTGRYVGGFGFITPTRGGMSKAKKAGNQQAGDNFAAQRAEKYTVIIANNVEYAKDLEVGKFHKKGGFHARHIMKRGIESKLAIMKKDMEQILKGAGKMNVGGI